MGGPLPRVVKFLCSLTVVVSALAWMLPGLAAELMLVPRELGSRPWAVVTYALLHGGLGHLLFNMLGLYLLGPALERRWGSRCFLAVYAGAGLGGAVLTAALAPDHGVVGASAAVYALLLGYGRLWPDARFYLWAVLPVRARTVVIGMTALAFVGGMGLMGGGTAHFAHLGGLAAGWFLVNWAERPRSTSSRTAASRAGRFRTIG